MQDITIRNSERITFTTCPQSWWWAYVERLRSADISPALRFGSLVHSALEEFYRPGLKRGPRPAETFERLYEEQQATMYKQGVRDEDGTWHELAELGVPLLEAYYDKYGKDDRWYVVATEAPFRVTTEDRESGLVFTVVGVVDGVWRDRETKKLYVVDHKTCKDDPTKKDEALILDEQSGTYWSYGVDYYRQTGLLKPNQPLSGMVFNFLRKGKPDSRPTNAAGHALNQDGSVSKRQPTPLFHRSLVLRDAADGEMVRWRTEAQAYHMNLIRRGKLRLTKTPGTLHNPHCNWCQFKGMCELHEVGADISDFKEGAFTKWDPYEQHELEAERN